MSLRNTAKADIVLKNFWKDNAHFADLFNAVLFNGEQKLHPEDLEKEADVDLFICPEIQRTFRNNPATERCQKKDSLWNGFCNLGY